MEISWNFVSPESGNPVLDGQKALKSGREA